MRYKAKGQYSFHGKENPFIAVLDIDDTGKFVGPMRDPRDTPEPTHDILGQLNTLDGRVEMEFVKKPHHPTRADIYYKLANENPQDGFLGEYKGYWEFRGEVAQVAEHNTATKNVRVPEPEQKNKASLILTLESK